MSGRRKCFVACAALLTSSALCAPLRAQVQIDKIDWQASRVAQDKTLPFEAVSELKLKLVPYQKHPDKLRAVVTVRNSSAKPVEGLVLRCALSLRLVKLPSSSAVKNNGGAVDSGSPESGFWAVPFRVEELRISRIRPGGVYAAKLIHSALNEQLKKLRNTGFWADALKLQAMLDPRTGDEPAMIMKESVIEIKKP